MAEVTVDGDEMDREIHGSEESSSRLLRGSFGVVCTGDGSVEAFWGNVHGTRLYELENRVSIVNSRSSNALS